jgi:flagellin-like protein
MKGISPVVATVLLIAITVIAAMGVWYYMENFASSNMKDVSAMRSIDITNCYAPESSGAVLMIKNENSKSVDDEFTIYYKENLSAPSGNPTFSVTLGSKQGAVGTATTTQPLETSVEYIAIADGFSQITFTCNS